MQNCKQNAYSYAFALQVCTDVALSSVTDSPKLIREQPVFHGGSPDGFRRENFAKIV